VVGPNPNPFFLSSSSCQPLPFHDIPRRRTLNFTLFAKGPPTTWSSRLPLPRKYQLPFYLALETGSPLEIPFCASPQSWFPQPLFCFPARLWLTRGSPFSPVSSCASGSVDSRLKILDPAACGTSSLTIFPFPGTVGARTPAGGPISP